MRKMLLALFLFTRLASAAETVTVLAPAPGAQWGVGSTQRIRWGYNNFSGTFTVELSRDGGASFSVLDSNWPGNGQGDFGNYYYRVTACVITCPETAIVRVTSNDFPSATDDSIGIPVLNATPPTVRKPGVGAVVVGGLNFTIVWVHATGYLSHFTVELARDGTNFTEVIAADTVAQWSQRGEYYWAPGGVCSSPGSCVIRVTDSLGMPGYSASFNIQ